MASIANREIKRFHQGKSQVTFGYTHDSDVTTLLIMINTPGGTWASLAIDQRQTQELIKWLQEQYAQKASVSS